MTRLTFYSYAFNAVTSALPGLLCIANPLQQAMPTLSEFQKEGVAHPFTVHAPGQLDVPQLKRTSAMKEDYLSVRFWKREAYNDHEKFRKATSETPDSYIENEDGLAVSKETLNEIGAVSRRLILEMFGKRIIPKTWGVLDAKSREFYLNSMENENSELRLCHHQWKADLFASKSYSSIRDNHAGKYDAGFPSAKKIKQEPKIDDGLSNAGAAVGDKRKGVVKDAEQSAAKRTKVSSTVQAT